MRRVSIVAARRPAVAAGIRDSSGATGNVANFCLRESLERQKEDRERRRGVDKIWLHPRRQRLRAPSGVKGHRGRRFKQNRGQQIAWNSQLSLGTPEQIVALVNTEVERFDATNLATAVHRLGKYMDQRVLGVLPHCIRRIGEFDAQGLGNIAWGLATSKVTVIPEAWDALFQASLDYGTENFSAQGLTNLVWAIATANARQQTARKVLKAVAIEAVSRVDEFTPQGLCNLVWSFAIAGAVDLRETSELFAAVARASLRPLEDGKFMLDQFTPQGIACTAWAFSSIGFAAPAFFDRVADMVVSMPHRFDTRSLSSLAWAFAIAGAPAPHLYAAIVNAFQEKSDCINRDPQAVANTLWALACANEPELLTATADVLLPSNPEDYFEDSAQRVQLYQVYLYAKRRSTIGRQLLSPAFAQQCNAAYLDTQVEVFSPSDMQRSVALALKQIGWKHFFEFQTLDGLLVDMAQPQTRTLIEVYGPYHYMLVIDDLQQPVSREARHVLLDGATKFKENLLKQAGWTVHRVPYFDWPDGGHAELVDQQRRDYLMAMLFPAGANINGGPRSPKSTAD